VKPVAPTPALIKAGYAQAISKWLEADSSEYDRHYGIDDGDLGNAYLAELDLYGEDA
jgi:hypothetical protein